MSELLVIGFDEKHKADEVMLEVLKEEQEHMVDLEDAVVVTKNAAGKIRVKPYYDLLAATRGTQSQFWGTLITNLLEDSDQETLAKIGINKQSCESIEQMMQPNSSAIFVLLKSIDFEQATARIEKYQGKILRHNLPSGSEAELLQAISG